MHCFSCGQAEKKYVCPRCNREYCSVACYQSPNHLDCSEDFYKECVQEEMSLRRQVQRQSTLDNVPGVSDDMRHMYDILKRMESTTSDLNEEEEEDYEELDSDDEPDEDDDGNNCTDLSERLKGVDINDADAVWNKLTETERAEFGEIIKSEDVSSILPTFNPWWENKVQKVLISEVCADTSKDLSSKEHQYSGLEYPNILGQLNFQEISKKAPASCVAFNILNVLAAYASTVRFFYGEHSTNSYEAVNYLLAICANLRVNANFDDIAVAVESIRHEAHTEGLTFDDGDVQQIRKDLDSLTEGPDPVQQNSIYVQAALSDLHRLLTIAKSMRKPDTSVDNVTVKMQPSKEQAKEFDKFLQRFGDHKIVQFQDLDRFKVKTSIKKVEYYLAYVQAYQ